MTQTTMIKPEDVKQLRDQTGAGIMDCKRALEESEGDVDKAVAWLRAKGLSTAAKKAGREAREGVVTSYIHHGGRLGVLLELNCETDFVARTDDFQQLARELAMQVAGLGPLFVSREDVPADVLDEKRRAFSDEATAEGRPADRIGDIVEGKLNKWLESVVLLEQPYRDTDKKVADLITESVAKLGENIRVAAVRPNGGWRDGRRAERRGGRLAWSGGPPPTRQPYRRVLLKLSGEALMGPRQYGIDPEVARNIAGQVAEAGRAACRSPSSSAAETSSAACRRLRPAWTDRPPTTWACWPP